jgi:hypothetical protein
MKQELETIVDECLSAIQSGDATLDSCLSAHPEHAEEIGPLLHIAAHSHSILSPESPRPEFVQSTRSRLMKSIESKRDIMQKERVGLRWLQYKPAYLFVTILLVLVLFSSGIGVVRASADSLPGDRLYGVKLASEQIQLAMSRHPVNDAALLIEFAGERLSEAEQLVNQGRYEDLELAMAELEETLDALASLDLSEETPEPGSLAYVEEKIEKHIYVLNRVLEQVPDSAKGAIERAIERSNHSHEVIKKVKSEEHPSNSAPGQLKQNESSDDQPGRGNGKDKDKPEKTEKPKK